MKYIVAVLFLSLLYGCTSKEHPMEKYGFDITEEIHFHPIHNDFLFKPTAIEFFDSLLLVHDPVEENTYTLFNAYTSELILCGGQKGSGPNDIMYGQFIDKINAKGFQVVDMISRKTLVFNIDTILDRKKFLPVRSFFYDDLFSEKPEGLESCYYVNDSLMWGLGNFPKGKYLCLTAEGDSYIGNYPQDIKMEISPFYLYQGVLHVSQERNRILYHSPLGYYYELYEEGKEGKWKKRFEEYLPLVEHVNDAVTDATPMGICSADFGIDCLFLLFSGRTIKESPTEAFLASHILMMDFDGNKRKCLETDRLNVSICVDTEHDRIYAIAKNPDNGEYEVGYYIYRNE